MSEVVVIGRNELQNLIETAVKRAIEGLKLNSEPDNDYMNADEVCNYLGIAKSTLNNWKRENKIPYSRLGNRVLFSKRKIDETLQKNEISNL